MLMGGVEILLSVQIDLHHLTLDIETVVNAFGEVMDQLRTRPIDKNEEYRVLDSKAYINES
jgi:hypothetical protein